MAYKYYCTNCGQLISQETVLFNMQNLVLEDDKQSFETFSMYMTLEQINNLIARGTPLESGYRQIQLSFTEVMQIISGWYNLNKPELASLTLKQIDEYLNQGMEEGPVVKQPQKKKTGGLNFAMKSVMVEADVGEEKKKEDAAKAEEKKKEDAAKAEEKKEEDTPAKAEEKKIPSAIQALSTLGGDNVAGDQTVENKIRRELELLKNAFGEQDFIDLEIAEFTAEDNQKKPVVIGYQIIYPNQNPRKHRLCCLRVCPDCKASIYEEAGRAEHQTVVFMGTQGSGKTSAILAMTHFLHRPTDPIWENCMPVNEDSALLDARHPLLKKELEDYVIGVSPNRTQEERKQAYCASFWFHDEEKGSHLLTLTDMPGELMGDQDNPKINVDKLINSHRAALCCDAFVLCFDATTVFKANLDEDGNPINQEIRNNARREVLTLVNKLDQLQKLRLGVIKERDGANANTSYVPTLILITKDVELEQQQEKLQAKSPIPMEMLYCFQAEREYIQSNKIYSSISETISKYEKLHGSYHAMLRCSPFGYAAPYWDDIKKYNAPYHTPSPKNIDDAVKWLLKLVGVLPAPGNLELDNGVLSMDDYSLNRVQYRTDRPKEGEELEEALSRCTLFENPGYFDERVLEAHTEGFFAKLRLKAAMMNKLIKNDKDPR